MIPCEILKKIRQIEIRTTRLATGSAARGTVRIPTGFRRKAQGCEAPAFAALRRGKRATLGHRSPNITNRNAVAAIPLPAIARGVRLNPVGVATHLLRITQDSSCLATLGWRTQSLWDWTNHAALRLGLRPQPRSEKKSLQPTAQFRRIPSAMPDGADDHLGSFWLDGEKNRMRPRSGHSGSAGQTTDGRKPFRVFANDFEKKARNSRANLCPSPSWRSS